MTGNLLRENTTYFKRLQYQTYDVTGMIRPGENVFALILADGWWAGRIGTTGDCCQYGNRLGLLLEAVLEYSDGTRQVISGEDGVSSTGPLVYSDLFVGEKYDAAKELGGWELAGYDDRQWKKVLPVQYPMNNLVGQYAPPVKELLCLKPERIFTSPAGGDDPGCRPGGGRKCRIYPYSSRRDCDHFGTFGKCWMKREITIIIFSV